MCNNSVVMRNYSKKISTIWNFSIPQSPTKNTQSIHQKNDKQQQQQWHLQIKISNVQIQNPKLEIRNRQFKKSNTIKQKLQTSQAFQCPNSKPRTQNQKSTI
eukprot:TRINITY_DN70030_c0_g1_i1.p1 TRINITY_DN70030_c0_g1~~TRINITY_DN70030_c0_g1_i1.p1  ORF type:complete len:102 (+),score=10.41 TRINITY_DN70030_c0_g1_i1:149-454(+)